MELQLPYIMTCFGFYIQNINKVVLHLHIHYRKTKLNIQISSPQIPRTHCDVRTILESTRHRVNDEMTHHDATKSPPPGLTSITQQNKNATSTKPRIRIIWRDARNASREICYSRSVLVCRLAMPEICMLYSHFDFISGSCAHTRNEYAFFFFE